MGEGKERLKKITSDYWFCADNDLRLDTFQEHRAVGVYIAKAGVRYSIQSLDWPQLMDRHNDSATATTVMAMVRILHTFYVILVLFYPRCISIPDVLGILVHRLNNSFVHNRLSLFCTFRVRLRFRKVHFWTFNRFPRNTAKRRLITIVSHFDYGYKTNRNISQIHELCFEFRENTNVCF